VTDDQLAVIRERHASRIAGPYMWSGHRSGPMHLSTRNRGRIFVMSFARLGMRDAQPVFQCGRGGTPAEEEDARKRGGGWMTKAAKLAVQEVTYRDDITTIDHPDARGIEHSWSDVQALLEEVDRLRSIVESGVLAV
jgi:hypothetical protein